jgi:hypothetical protein
VKQQLRVPVPETVTASYLIPLKTVMTVTEARRQILKAVEGCVPDPLRTVILHGIRQGAVIVHVTAAPVPPDGTSSVFAEELTRLAGSPPFVQVTVTSPASVIAVQEWKARGSAAALAASLGVPLIDARALDVLTAQEALTSLPDAKFLSRPDTDVAVGLSLQPWVRLHGFADQEKCWATSNGMWRFGLPEFRMGGYRPDLRREVEQILLGVIFRAWTGLIEEAQATPRGGALVRMPRSVQIPAEMQIHRRHLDQARGVPNRGGSWAEIGLRLDPSPRGRNWLTVCPPSWGEDEVDYLADICHVLFGFEKPSWYYLPHIGALLEAAGSLPDARRRFNDGELPSGAQFMVRYITSDREDFRWARVESWGDDDVVVCDAGRELAPVVQDGRTVPIDAERIIDWAIWTDDEGAAEGARTEGIGHGF